MKKVLVTGINGLVGSNLPEFLTQRAYEVHGVGRGENHITGITYHTVDLFDSVAISSLFHAHQFDSLIHLAWDTRPGIYLQDNDNYKWLESSLHLLRVFHQHGGKRAVFAGTCLEYEYSDIPIKENAEINPCTPYALCKDLLNRAATSYSEKNDIMFSWGRIFYVYGVKENPNRLFPYLIRSLKLGESPVLRSSQLVKDYMYANDIANAFAHILESDVTGNINVCSNQGYSLADIASTIEKSLGKQGQIHLDTQNSTEPAFFVGDNTKLVNDVGFNQYTPLADGIKNILSDLEINTIDTIIKLDK